MLKRRGFLGLLGAAALTPIAALKLPGVVSDRIPAMLSPGNMGRVYARQLALSMAETQEIVVARVMDHAFNEIWFSYPNRAALFEWLDKGAVIEDHSDYECVGHGDYRPRRYPSNGEKFDPEYARSLFPKELA